MALWTESLFVIENAPLWSNTKRVLTFHKEKIAVLKFSLLDTGFHVVQAGPQLHM